MKTEYPSNRWLRALDMVGMVIAPISMTLPIFFFAVGFFITSGSNGTYYTQAIVLFLVALVGFILLGSLFVGPLKRYVNHQATRDDVIAVRLMYSIFILGSLIVYFMIFSYFLYGPRS